MDEVKGFRQSEIEWMAKWLRGELPKSMYMGELINPENPDEMLVGAYVMGKCLAIEQGREERQQSYDLLL